MPYTSHGHAYGVVDTSQPRPTAMARCGGPGLCAVCSKEAAASTAGKPADDAAEQIARAFHEAYERLAPGFGYKTREASAVPWADVPDQNKNLMVAVAAALIADGTITPA